MRGSKSPELCGDQDASVHRRAHLRAQLGRKAQDGHEADLPQHRESQAVTQGKQLITQSQPPVGACEMAAPVSSGDGCCWEQDISFQGSEQLSKSDPFVPRRQGFACKCVQKHAVNAATRAMAPGMGQQGMQIGPSEPHTQAAEMPHQSGCSARDHQ